MVKSGQQRKSRQQHGGSNSRNTRSGQWFVLHLCLCMWQEHPQLLLAADAAAADVSLLSLVSPCIAATVAAVHLHGAIQQARRHCCCYCCNLVSFPAPDAARCRTLQPRHLTVLTSRGCCSLSSLQGNSCQAAAPSCLQHACALCTEFGPCWRSVLIAYYNNRHQPTGREDS
jgi:hypothetical protein